MKLQRYIVEFGIGADMHGQNVTKAAQRAVKDAVSRSCLCGLFDIFDIKTPDAMHIHLKVGCPFPDRLDRKAVMSAVPFGSVDLEAVSGGLDVPGLHLPALGEGDSIVIAVAALTVLIDTSAFSSGKTEGSAP